MKTLILGLAVVASTLAVAKITRYPFSAVMTHIIQSKELTALQRKDKRLANLELVQIRVDLDGTEETSSFKAELVFSNRTVGFTTCNVDATVENIVKQDEKTKITVNELGAPKFGKLDCAM